MASPHTAIPTAHAAPQETPPPRTSHAPSAGLLLLRLVLGLTLASHGTQKLFGWFGGNGIDGTAAFFDSVGYPAARTMALVAGLTETLGGLGLALGLLTPLAGAAALGTMLNALAVDWGSGFFAPEGVEYPLLMLAGAAAITLAGPGRYAVDRLLPGLRDHRLAYGAAAVVLGAATAGVVLLLRT